MAEAAGPGEAVRLVIWDLDETFWRGTLEEGPVAIPPGHLVILRRLAKRGILSAVSSKNDRGRAQAALEAAGAWKYFVFPRIAYAPKGAMVAEIIAAMQIRPASVLFIDDNPSNRAEVGHSNPGIQLAGPEIIRRLLADPRCKGRRDTAMARLAQYRILEAKAADRAALAEQGRGFLRQSRVRISFHLDVMAEFDRLHEMINRTNQLNFTKHRMAEERGAARAALEAALATPPFPRAAYIKVADRYGDYGICGFYMQSLRRDRGRVLDHFLFSCRILDMGVEQFVYRKLRWPPLDIAGEVVSDPAAPGAIDWIEIVDDAAAPAAAEPAPPGPVVCLRGGCELDQIAHYLPRYRVITQYSFPHRGWSVALPASQLAAIEGELADPRHAALLERLPGLHRKCLDGMAEARRAAIVLLSFSLEPTYGHYRHRESGLLLPLTIPLTPPEPRRDLTTLDYASVTARAAIDMSEADWAWFRDCFTYEGHLEPARFAANVQALLARLRGRRVIVIAPNSRHGRPNAVQGDNARINAVLDELAIASGHQTIRLDDLIAGPGEVIDTNHFTREVYARLSAAVRETIEAKVAA